MLKNATNLRLRSMIDLACKGGKLKAGNPGRNFSLTPPAHLLNAPLHAIRCLEGR